MKKLLLSVMAGSFLFAGSFFNLQLTNETIMLEGQANVSYNKPFYIRGGYLIDTKNKNFVYAGLKAEGQPIGVDTTLKLSLLVDVAYMEHLVAVPIGIGASSYIQNFEWPIFIRAEGSYAPKILSFDKAEKFYKYKAEVGVTFIENAEAFVGYRSITFNDDGDNRFYVGVGYIF